MSRRRRVIHRRRRHPPGCPHCLRVRTLGRQFDAWRASWEAAAETASYGYEAELADYRREHPAPTFRRYLVSMRGAGWPMSGRLTTRDEVDAA